MLKIFSKKWAKNMGFTLIELLVVIAIIGVLASIVLASLNSARKKARDTRRITDVKQLQLALELYFDGKNSAYPVATATCTDVPTAVAGENNGLQDLVINNFIPQIPRDPLSKTGAPVCYKYGSPSSSITTYHLGAVMEDATITVLTQDKDKATAASGWTNDFDGTSANVTTCDATAGTPQGQATPTEKCYDVVP